MRWLFWVCVLLFLPCQVSLAAVVTDGRAMPASNGVVLDKFSLESEGTTDAIQNNDVQDPLEKFNRAMFAVNKVFDKILFEPVAISYNRFIPERIRNSIGNVLSTLKTPVSIVNYLLRGDIKKSADSLWRFNTNMLFGIGGIFDIASKTNLVYEEISFGDNFNYYGANVGPYLFLPILGPTTASGFFGRLIDYIMDPFNHVGKRTFKTVRWSLTAVDTKASYLDVQKNVDDLSFDAYSSMRSIYMQHFNYRREQQKMKVDSCSE